MPETEQKLEPTIINLNSLGMPSDTKNRVQQLWKIADTYLSKSLGEKISAAAGKPKESIALMYAQMNAKSIGDLIPAEFLKRSLITHIQLGNFVVPFTSEEVAEGEEVVLVRKDPSLPSDTK